MASKDKGKKKRPARCRLMNLKIPKDARVKPDFTVPEESVTYQFVIPESKRRRGGHP